MIDRMLRAVLLGILTTSALAACKSTDSTPAAQPGAVAGKVLEVTGAVSVAGKRLTVGDSVSSDDAVETGADGNVVIELAHNQARWELGPNQKVKPSESLAWTMPTKTGPAAQVDQATSAAGRPAERNAADTEATSGAQKAGQPAPGVATPSQTTKPPPMQPSAEGKTAKPHTVQPPMKISDSVEAKPLGLLGDAERSDSGAGAGEDQKKTDPTLKDLAPLKRLASCVPAGSSVHIKAHVANHKATISFVGDVDATVQACIRTAAPKLTLSVDGDVDLTLTP
jgi:hypothetical protein